MKTFENSSYIIDMLTPYNLTSLNDKTVWRMFCLILMVFVVCTFCG